MTLSKPCVTQVHSCNIAHCTLAVLVTTRSCIGLSGCKVFVVQEGRKLPFSVLWILKYHILIMQLKNKVIKKYTLPLLLASLNEGNNGYLDWVEFVLYKYLIHCTDCGTTGVTDCSWV